MQVKFKKLKPNAISPNHPDKENAGTDISACFENEMLVIKPHATVLVPTGLAIEFPDDYVCYLMPRSSNAVKKGLLMLNSIGVIDSSYRGEIQLILYNITDRPVTINHGDRLGQLIFQKIEHPEFIESEELSETIRGTGGFGSTGR